MIVRCSWCEEILGEKEPLEDRTFTDTICNDCQERELRAEGLLEILGPEIEMPWMLKRQAI